MDGWMNGWMDGWVNEWLTTPQHKRIHQQLEAKQNHVREIRKLCKNRS